MSLLYFVVLPLLSAFLVPFFAQFSRYVSAVLYVGLFAFALTLELPLHERLAFDSPLAISFMLDSASHLFVIFFSFVMVLHSLYSLQEPSDKANFIATNMLASGVFGLVLSHDIFNIYIFFELASISAYILTSLNRDAKAYGGAIRYMIMGGVASLFLLLGIVLLYLSLGVLDIGAIAERFSTIAPNIQFLILLSLFLGFGIKAEIFPLNFWVADIYQASRSNTAALFSSLLSKAYIFLFFHLAYLWHVDLELLTFVALLGAIGFVVAELSALRSGELKRIFALSTLGQIALIVVAFSFGSVGALSAALFLLFTHALAKWMLFMGLGILEKAFASTRSEVFAKFQSLFLVTLFGVGFLSLLGIPPFAGFMAKLGLLVALVEHEAYGFIALILVVSLVEAAYLFRLLASVRTQEPKEPVSVPWMQRILLGSVMLLLLVLGVVPELLTPFTDAAAKAMLGEV